MNRASLDRGFGRCIVLKKYGATLRRYPNRARDRIVAPQPSRERRLFSIVWFGEGARATGSTVGRRLIVGCIWRRAAAATPMRRSRGCAAAQA